MTSSCCCRPGLPGRAEPRRGPRFFTPYGAVATAASPYTLCRTRDNRPAFLAAVSSKSRALSLLLVGMPATRPNEDDHAQDVDQGEEEHDVGEVDERQPLLLEAARSPEGDQRRLLQEERQVQHRLARPPPWLVVALDEEQRIADHAAAVDRAGALAQHGHVEREDHDRGEHDAEAEEAEPDEEVVHR